MSDPFFLSMPELPDIELYLHAFRGHIVGQPLARVVIKSPFLLRTCDIDPAQVRGTAITDVSRIGKRIVWHLPHHHYLVFHLMIAGRFHKKKPGTLPRSKQDLAAFGFPGFTLMLTEAAPKKRAALHLVQGSHALQPFQRRGMDVTCCNPESFARRLQQQNRTVKLALIDPDQFDGIGNAYSDEILHRARLSPYARTGQLDADQIHRLFEATRDTLREWTERLIAENGDRFPEKVTAFRPAMAVHGRFGLPCPVCLRPVQRIVFAEREWNYCAVCQTGGRRLADRRLSRLLRDEWPKEVE